MIDINKVIDSSVYTLMQRMFEDGDRFAVEVRRLKNVRFAVPFCNAEAHIESVGEIVREKQEATE